MTEFSEFEFKFEFAALDFIGSQWHEQINDKQLFFGKIITSIYTDCDYCNN